MLREALADLLESESRYGPVVDADGRVQGVLSLEVIGQTLQAPPEVVPTGADAATASAAGVDAGADPGATTATASGGSA